MTVIYNGKEYVLLQQYASGYCEIMQEGAEYKDIKLVHFSELTMKE